ncbi:MAG: class I SAM-dependent methyltransferase [Acidobacteriia bacterium]|nr:class I SAM-dependent methyltransferase [Terriglobia bacterium]
MSWLESKRVPLPEVGTAAGEATVLTDRVGGESRSPREAACVEHAIQLGMHQGVLLNIGVGDGAIALELAGRCPEVTVLSIDRSAEKIASATEAAEREGLQGRVFFQATDLRRTKFKSEYFDGVLCLGILHQVEDPLALLNEIARVVKRDGALLVRDLRRPSRFSLWWHSRWFGRKYPGWMRAAFHARVRAAYSYSEWQKFFQASDLHSSARIFVRGLSHMGIERPARETLFAALAAHKARREYLAETEAWRKEL